MRYDLSRKENSYQETSISEEELAYCGASRISSCCVYYIPSINNRDDVVSYLNPQRNTKKIKIKNTTTKME